jgi:hypothetical protein
MSDSSVPAADAIGNVDFFYGDDGMHEMKMC